MKNQSFASRLSAWLLLILACVPALAGIVTISGGRGVGSAPPPSPTIIFGEDFEARSIGSSPQLTAAQTGTADAKWGPENGGSDSAVQVTGTGHNSSARSLAFDYGAGQFMAEQRYVLDSTGAAQYKEIWVEFYLFVPANWQVPPGGQNNNKFFFLYNDDTGNASYFDFEFYQYVVDATFNPNHYQGVWLTHQMKRNGVNVAGGFIGSDDGNPHGELYPFIDAAVDPGTWLQLRFHVRMDQQSSYTAGTPLSQRGVVEVFKNGQSIWHRASETGNAATTGSPLPRYNSFNTGNNGAGYSLTHMSGGYILGNANATYAVETIYQIDDIKFYSTNPGWGN